MHALLSIKNLGLSFHHTVCFENFSADVRFGHRVGMVGRNGSGKSSLLNILRGALLPTEGEVVVSHDATLGYVEQTIEEHHALSGAHRFNKQLNRALAGSPNVLLLDEPTNHLDRSHRKKLRRMLKNFHGTVLIASHDEELLCHCVDTLWHLDNGRIHQFTGRYDDYIREQKRCLHRLKKELVTLKREQRNAHESLMQEQKRAAVSRSNGKKSIGNKKWPTVVSPTKAYRARRTSGKKKAAIDRKKRDVLEQLASENLPDVVVPKFSLGCEHARSGLILSFNEADIGYSNETIVLHKASLSVGVTERVAIRGKNGSGKSTLLKAIVGLKGIDRTGEWYTPKTEHIGYLDQHFAHLIDGSSVHDNLKKIQPGWRDVDVRRHLNAFLGRKNDNMLRLASTLSSGEKVRLSLALIAAKVPRLLVLDEVTNNIDLETKEQVIQLLKHYPGSMVIVSHDEVFLKAIGLDHHYAISNGLLYREA